MDELQEFVSQGEVRKVRVKLGHRLSSRNSTSRRARPSPCSGSRAAVLLTKLRIEVERAPEAAGELPASGFSQE